MKKQLEKMLPLLIGNSMNLQSVFSKRAAAQRAFALFCTPRSGRLSDKQKEYLNPYKSNKLKVEGCSIQTYHWEGTGPSVLLVHGWESNAHRWWKLIPELQKSNYNIYAFDAPGHGASGGNQFSAVLYAKAIHAVASHHNPTYQVAHSVGALSSLLYYRDQQPAALEKLVILGAPSELKNIMADYQRILGFNDKILQELDVLVQEKFGFTFEAFSAAAFAQSIDIPGLIIHDKLDKITPVKASRDIHKNWKNSTYYETEGLGHSLHQDGIRKKIIDFITY